MVEGLLKVASENKGGDLAEKALYGAFTAAREKKDYAKEREIGAKLLTDYPKTGYTSDVLATLGRHSAEAGQFPEAAQWYEQLGARMGQSSTGLRRLDGRGPDAAWCSTTCPARRRTSSPRPTWAAIARARRWRCSPRPSSRRAT